MEPWHDFFKVSVLMQEAFGGVTHPAASTHCANTKCTHEDGIRARMHRNNHKHPSAAYYCTWTRMS